MKGLDTGFDMRRLYEFLAARGINVKRNVDIELPRPAPVPPLPPPPPPPPRS